MKDKNMAVAKNATTDRLGKPVFTIAKPEKITREYLGKGKIPLSTMANLPAVLEEIIEKAQKGGAKSARGTITFY
jgi:hypothetical protein